MEIAQRFRALAYFAEDPGSVPRTTCRVTISSLSSGIWWSLLASVTSVQTYVQANHPHAENKNKEVFKDKARWMIYTSVHIQMCTHTQIIKNSHLAVDSFVFFLCLLDSHQWSSMCWIFCEVLVCEIKKKTLFVSLENPTAGKDRQANKWGVRGGGTQVVPTGEGLSGSTWNSQFP